MFHRSKSKIDDLLVKTVLEPIETWIADLHLRLAPRQKVALALLVVLLGVGAFYRREIAEASRWSVAYATAGSGPSPWPHLSSRTQRIARETIASLEAELGARIRMDATLAPSAGNKPVVRIEPWEYAQIAIALEPPADVRQAHAARLLELAVPSSHL